MTADRNKGITSIRYNHLNLPTRVTFNTGSRIDYTYDATGVKQSKQVTASGVSSFTFYAGNFIYEQNTTGQKLAFFSHPEGYVEKNGNVFNYIYQYKDHLGNVRLSYKSISTTGVNLQIVEEINYYPFGMTHKGYGAANSSMASSAALKFGFGGKELQDELGLEWYDITARNYDAALGRWMNIDPYAHNYMKLSPYNYTSNNPVFFIDQAGKFIVPGQTAQEYKRLNSYLKNGIQGITQNKRVMAALRKHGQFTDEQIKKHLTFGEGPTLEVRDLGLANGVWEINGRYLKGAETIGGVYGDGEKSTIIDLDVDLVEKLENAKGRDVDYYLFVVASTILHELTHYGEDRGDNVKGEEGELFEIDAYGGKVKDKSDAKPLIDNWLKRKKEESEFLQNEDDKNTEDPLIPVNNSENEDDKDD
jgi:RHS repeat-associated protein